MFVMRNWKSNYLDYRSPLNFREWSILWHSEHFDLWGLSSNFRK